MFSSCCSDQRGDESCRRRESRYVAGVVDCAISLPPRRFSHGAAMMLNTAKRNARPTRIRRNRDGSGCVEIATDPGQSEFLPLFMRM